MSTRLRVFNGYWLQMESQSFPSPRTPSDSEMELPSPRTPSDSEMERADKLAKQGAAAENAKAAASATAAASAANKTSATAAASAANKTAAKQLGKGTGGAAKQVCKDIGGADSSAGGKTSKVGKKAGVLKKPAAARKRPAASAAAAAVRHLDQHPVLRELHRGFVHILWKANLLANIAGRFGASAPRRSWITSGGTPLSSAITVAGCRSGSESHGGCMRLHRPPTTCDARGCSGCT